MKTKHTPGPWKQCGASNQECQCGQIWSIPHDIVVAVAQRDFQGADQAYPKHAQFVANMAVLAAAPDMLVELRIAREIIANITPDKQFSSEALATRLHEINVVLHKAEGK